MNTTTGIAIGMMLNNSNHGHSAAGAQELLYLFIGLNVLCVLSWVYTLGKFLIKRKFDRYDLDKPFLAVVYAMFLDLSVGLTWAIVALVQFGEYITGLL